MTDMIYYSYCQKDRFPIKISNIFSKVFDYIVHDFLQAKLGAYGFEYNSLELNNGFLSGR